MTFHRCAPSKAEACDQKTSTLIEQCKFTLFLYEDKIKLGMPSLNVRIEPTVRG